MFDQSTLAEFASRFADKLPRHEVEKAAKWIEDKQAAGEAFSNPNAALEALLRRKADAAATAPRAAVSRAPDLPFVGWDASGSCIRSAVPVTNPQTDFAVWLVREIRDQALTPADAIRLIARQSEAIHRAFGLDTLARWHRHEHWEPDENGNPVRVDRECSVSCWGSLSASSSLAETVRTWGGTTPWLRDPNAWQAVLEREASRRTAA